jgi:cell division protein FtsW (lipid II flippase)
VSAVALAAVGVIGVGDASRQPTWTAAYLTVVGVVVTVMSLLRADRREAGWVGGLLLALASWVRLWDLGVQAPEPYTLPSAAALLVVGLAHLRRRPGSSTLTALGPGLSLALLPSLLWTLNEPTGPRALLLGVGCLALVLAGVRLRWTAPIALGATVGGLLVLRLAAPYIGDAVPRWVLIGAAGALLIGLGATWERRLQEAREVLGYVRALR